MISVWRYYLVAAIGALLVFLLGACSSPSAETVSLGESVDATPPPVSTRVPRAVATVAPSVPLTGTPRITLTPGGTLTATGTVTATLTPPSSPTATGTFTPTATGTAVATTTPTPAQTLTPTPATTGTPVPSRQVLSSASSLAQEVETFRESVNARDTNAMLRQQRNLLEAADKAEASVKEDRSTYADHLRSAIQFIRDGASGDLGKLDSAMRELRDAVGKQDGEEGSRDQGTRTPTVTSADLRSMAESLSRKVESFDQALQSHSAESTLRQQKELLDEMSGIDQAVKNDRTKRGEDIRSALEAIRNALAGDESKLDEARRALKRAMEE